MEIFSLVKWRKFDKQEVSESESIFSDIKISGVINLPSESKLSLGFLTCNLFSSIEMRLFVESKLKLNPDLGAPQLNILLSKGLFEREKATAVSKT